MYNLKLLQIILRYNDVQMFFSFYTKASLLPHVSLNRNQCVSFMRCTLYWSKRVFSLLSDGSLCCLGSVLKLRPDDVLDRPNGCNRA